MSGKLHPNRQAQKVTDKRFLVDGTEADYVTAAIWNQILKESSIPIIPVLEQLQYEVNGKAPHFPEPALGTSVPTPEPLSELTTKASRHLLPCPHTPAGYSV